MVQFYELFLSLYQILVVVKENSQSCDYNYDSIDLPLICYDYITGDGAITNGMASTDFLKSLVARQTVVYWRCGWVGFSPQTETKVKSRLPSLSQRDHNKLAQDMPH